MFIILEGPDGAGKTTLQHTIVSRIKKRAGSRGVAVMHCGQPEEKTREWVLEQYVHAITDYRPGSGQHIVADRWHFGEAVYAPIYRPETDCDGFGLLGVAGWRWVELFLLSRGARVFPVSQPLNVLEERLGIRGDDLVRHDHLSRIVTNYSYAYRESPTSTELAVSPADRESLADAADMIIDEAAFTEDRAVLAGSYSLYIGRPRPRVLLVGDKPNNTGPRGALGQDKPFYPIAGNSSEFLLTALPDDTWPYVGIINASAFQSSRAFNIFLGNLSMPSVVALGRAAETHLEQQLHYTDFVTLPHPQHVRRFHFDRKDEYGAAIRDVSRGVTPKTGGLWAR